MNDGVSCREERELKRNRKAHGRRNPKAPTTMVLDTIDIWIPHTKNTEIPKRETSVRISTAPMTFHLVNCFTSVII